MQHYCYCCCCCHCVLLQALCCSCSRLVPTALFSGPFEICMQPERMRDSHTVSTFCHAACEPPTQQQSTPLPQPANQLPIQPLAQLGHGKRLHPCAASESDLRRKCKRGGFSDLNWPAERAAIPAAAAQLSRLEYHSRAMRHRFCLVAPGDSTSMAAHASHSAPHCPKGCCHLCSLRSAHQVSPWLPLRATTALHRVCFR